MYEEGLKMNKIKQIKTLPKYLFLFILFSFLFIFSSCSSAPRNTGDIITLRSQAENLLESGNREAAKGNFNNALLLLTEAKRNAILVDDSSLIIRVCLSKGNVLFSMEKIEEAYAEWEYALLEAQRFGDIELLSISRIFIARGDLVLSKKTPQSVLDEVTQESANIRNNNLFLAFSWQVRALTLRSLGRWQEAEDAAIRSLEIHERENIFENASYDWFLIASVRSLSENFQGAIQALEASISFDRRVENYWGLAASWRAMGDVYRRAGNNDDAMEAYRRARDIYAAMGNEHEVAQTERRMRNQ
jgi:tetratricopeptide (TPR) repeat protein